MDTRTIRKIGIGLALAASVGYPATGRADAAPERCSAALIGAIGNRLSRGLACERSASVRKLVDCRARVTERFGERLRNLGEACVKEADIAAMERDAELLAAQIGASARARVGRLVSVAGHWDTETVMDLSVVGLGYAASPPDVTACRAAGQCPPNILITRCRTELVEVAGEPDYTTLCDSAPESGFKLPPYEVEPDVGGQEQLGEYEWLVRGEAGTSFGPYDFEVRYTLGPGGNTLTGIGTVAGGTLWTFFVTGQRVP